MRWIWIDKFEKFEVNVAAVAIKNVSLAEEHLHDHFPGFPVMPASLMIEGMAQTAGILVGAARNFQEKVILAKIGKARFVEKSVGQRLQALEAVSPKFLGETLIVRRVLGAEMLHNLMMKKNEPQALAALMRFATARQH